MRIRLFLCLTCFVLPVLLSAQSRENLPALRSSGKALERIGALHEAIVQYQNIDLDTALLYSREALLLSRKVNNDSLIATSHARLTTTFYHLRKMDSLLVHAEQATNIAQSAGLPKLQAFVLKMQGIAYNLKGDFGQAVTSHERALELYKILRDTSGIGGAYANLGRVHQRNAEYDRALEIFYQAEQLFTQAEDPYGISVTASQIGDLFMDMETPEKAVPYLRKALTLTEPDGFPIQYGDLLIGLGAAYHLDSTQLDSAQWCFEQSLALFEKVGDLQGVAIAGNSLGNVQRDRGAWSEAFKHLYRSRDLAIRNNWTPVIAQSAKDLGLLYQTLGQADSAIYYFQRAFEISEATQLAFQEEAILESLYRFYKTNDQPAEALRFHERLTALLESTKGEAVEKEIAALETRYETEKKELRIATLETQAKLDQAKANAIILGLTGLMVLLALGVGFLIYRRHNERKLFELQKEVDTQEKERLAQELTFKNKQLTSHALHMVQKNKVLQVLKQGIGDLVGTAAAGQKKALRSLIRRIDFNIQGDEDWGTFKLYFEQTNQHFYNNLAKINDQLTNTDLKLCSLIKLNLNIKETAAILNIEPTSVKTARHRLRKKLKLETGQDLSSFIRQIGERV